jgi:hypothetical protein
MTKQENLLLNLWCEFIGDLTKLKVTYCDKKDELMN